MRTKEAGGELFVVSAPSGTGKTTLCREVCRRLEMLVYSVSHTTRPPRAGEVHGRDYFFLTQEDFQAMVDRMEFAEWAQVYNHRYGTARRFLEDRLAEGYDVILDVDVQGADQLRGSDLPAHYIFVLPPSWEVLEDRLRERGTESRAEIDKRLRWAREELKRWRHFPFVIVNADLEEALRDLESLVRAQRCRIERRAEWIKRRIERWIPSAG